MFDSRVDIDLLLLWARIEIRILQEHHTSNLRLLGEPRSRGHCSVRKCGDSVCRKRDIIFSNSGRYSTIISYTFPGSVVWFDSRNTSESATRGAIWAAKDNDNMSISPISRYRRGAEQLSGPRERPHRHLLVDSVVC